MTELLSERDKSLSVIRVFCMLKGGMALEEPSITGMVCTSEMFPRYFLISCFYFSAVPLGIIVVPGDSDLELCRTHIERLQEVRCWQTSWKKGRIFHQWRHSFQGCSMLELGSRLLLNSVSHVHCMQKMPGSILGMFRWDWGRLLSKTLERHCQSGWTILSCLNQLSNAV